MKDADGRSEKCNNAKIEQQLKEQLRQKDREVRGGGKRKRRGGRRILAGEKMKLSFRGFARVSWRNKTISIAEIDLVMLISPKANV